MAKFNEDYKPQDIEAKWQKHWQENKTFKAIEDKNKKKYYILDMFPYPSGSGLHVGHPEGYTATDILARFKRMNGFNVLHPMGWDAFGLPAEQHAVRTNTHPRVTTNKNIDNFRRQIQSMGMSYDWDREIDTTDEKYYKWTQWIFQQLYKKGLAYESFEPVWWCEQLGTVLANEEVIDGKSEVGGYPVTRKPMRQWVLKITEYADRLLEDLDEVNWPESIKEQQRNWIGKSEGAEVTFKVKDVEEGVTVFTTRPDTLFGATFFVLAPEHPLVKKITTKEQKSAVDTYIADTLKKSDRDRLATTEKTGVFTGGKAINPVNGSEIPIYIADYVLMSYGHGAIMAVPGHDARDHEFAKKYDLPILQVLSGGEKDINECAHEGDGKLINSDFLNGLDKKAAISKMLEWLESKNIGKQSTNYKLKDWLFSRQRYWGEPFPIIHNEDEKPELVPEEELPVKLPSIEDYKPAKTGESPLSKAEDWVNYKKDGKSYKRETNTMPQWAGSCWYYLRYLDPLNEKEAWSKEKESYWMPVDLYVGGAEHAVLHLLYARFWHKVLYDLKLVSTKEPFHQLVNQGMILGENGEKMSKSRGNVVNPDDVIREWGADAFRLYEMFMGPLEATKPWQTNGIVGCHRFLKRFWRIYVNENGEHSEIITDKPNSSELEKLFHKTVQKVTEDTEKLHFNTAISAMMELVNAIYKEKSFNRESSEALILLLNPYAPHIAEELWEISAKETTLSYHPWPTFNADLVKEETVTISIQVNGRMRGTIDLEKTASKDDALNKAKEVESVSRHLEGKKLVKEIYVPGRIINFVAK